MSLKNILFKEKRWEKTDDPLDKRNYDFKYEHENLRVFSDSKLDQNDPQVGSDWFKSFVLNASDWSILKRKVQQFLSHVAQTIQEQGQLRDQEEDHDPNSINVATFDSQNGTTHYKVRCGSLTCLFSMLFRFVSQHDDFSGTR